jgi:hypothetical protein
VSMKSRLTKLETAAVTAEVDRIAVELGVTRETVIAEAERIVADPAGVEAELLAGGVSRAEIAELKEEGRRFAALVRGGVR